MQLFCQYVHNFLLSEHRVHIYDSNFFKSLYHCEGERRTEASNNEPNAVVDASFQRGGGLWSGSCGTANEMDSSFTINNIAPSNRIVGGMETGRHQYPWMVCAIQYVKFMIDKIGPLRIVCLWNV